MAKRRKLRDDWRNARNRTAQSAVIEELAEMAGIPDQDIESGIGVRTVDPGTSTQNILTVRGPSELFLPAAMGGDADTYAIFQFWRDSGSIREDISANPNISQTNVARAYAPFSTVTTWHTSPQGPGVFLDYDCYFVLSDPNKLCPFDPAGTHTWMTYGVRDDSYKPVEINGEWWRMNRFASDDPEVPEGYRQPSSEWADWLTNPNEAITGVNRIEEWEDIPGVPE